MWLSLANYPLWSPGSLVGVLRVGAGYHCFTPSARALLFQPCCTLWKLTWWWWRKPAEALKLLTSTMFICVLMSFNVHWKETKEQKMLPFFLILWCQHTFMLYSQTANNKYLTPHLSLLVLLFPPFTHTEMNPIYLKFYLVSKEQHLEILKQG